MQLCILHARGPIQNQGADKMDFSFFKEYSKGTRYFEILVDRYDVVSNYASFDIWIKAVSLLF